MLKVKIEQGITLGICQSPFKGFLQFILESHFDAQSTTKQFRYFMIVPINNIIIWPVFKETLGGVAMIVDHHDNRIQTVAEKAGDLHAGHLEGAIPDDDDSTLVRLPKQDTDRRRHGIPHRCVIHRSVVT